MLLFWKNGYDATSIGDLVRATQINRFSLYQAFGNKHKLFLAALDRYSDSFVTAAFGRVEQEAASLREIVGYFDQLIRFAASTGVPGNGCLMANSMAELVFRDRLVREKVMRHFARQKRGFAHALRNARRNGELASGIKVGEMAHFLAVSTQGFSVYARLCNDLSALRSYVRHMLAPILAGSSKKTRGRPQAK